MKSTLVTLLVALGVSTTGGPSAFGVTISNPLSLSTQYVAGTLNGQPGDSNPITEEGYAQTILNLAQGGTSGVAPNTFQANTAFDYSGTITFNGGQSTVGINGDATIDIPAGWGGALAKYDGQNAGYVLFLFGGTASTIPEYPWNLWTTNHEQYQISHYTLFRGTGGLTPGTQSVPEGGAGVALLGLVLAGMGFVARRRALSAA
jgi:hypothetical protein